ncbi:hypothetical protein [Cellulomonas shaoxiangyii]|uniref:Uncharacterized protein n=1 Tax=Cellulomonas shaoxiangyii TaxID=2566013 RepID=A0A4V1CN32_9CELL|nr:hypothetical protein [Cellulomonas shaoxiangyii]QCB95035.1 hypothetical protein E5225_17165 [Cellulomonas shaoxiangyii]TGY86364.1 hypothetical protein E5226_02250 [Cellulomonas shaoxiangyii]
MQSGPVDHWYDVEVGGEARTCKRSYYDEAFHRGALQGISVSADDAMHHFVPTYTLSLSGVPTQLSYSTDDDGSLRVLAGSTVVATFLSYDWVEVRERHVASGSQTTDGL